MKMKYLLLFENFSEREDVIKEYDPRIDITYIIDTNKVPKSGDKVLDIDGDAYIWSKDYDDNVIGVIIDEIDGDPYNLSLQDDLESSNTQSPTTNSNFTKRTDLIDIPNVPKPELECVKEITLKDFYHRPIHIKISDKIILNNYSYDKGNDAKNFNIESINGKKFEGWISIEELTDNFKLIENTKTFENFYGLSMENLPKMVYSAMSYEFNTNFSENKESLMWIKNWINQNLEKIESGLSIYHLSNNGNDFLEVSKKLNCNTNDIIEYINTQIDEILG